MAEYIKREEFRLAMQHIYNDPTCPMHIAAEIEQIIDCAPAADVAPVRHGEWIWKHRHRGGINTYEGYDEMGEKHRITIDERYEVDDPYCSVCGKLNDGSCLNFCSNCGAKMDGGAGRAVD